jgi:serine/threonine-protein kinase
MPNGSIRIERIGPYKIIREIGYGGMGAVYLAVRDDDQFKKHVAIKLMKPGLDSDLRFRRFHRERQILANLDHPNIAKLLDGGTTEEGIPYLVMDYVEGIPIDNYCDEKKLPTIERLVLFQIICSAVQFAHQNLVVHRDIKPGNILVNTEGVPKLLDFGIAKLLHSDDKALTTSLLPMTPEYASPEQIRGETITTASDIYSLGILLYELLTGHRPYQLNSKSPVELQRVICQEEPEKPSHIIRRAKDFDPTLQLNPETVDKTREEEFEKLYRRLRGDLDNIVLMALRKDPQRRYASVQQFSEDIKRHLEGMPVLARKDTLGYRTGKFILRNKMAVAAALLVLLTLVGGIISTLRQARIAAQQRDKARIEAQKSAQINQFIQTMLSSADPEVQGKDVTVATVLNEASQRVEIELSSQPEIQAAVRTTIGKTYYGLGLYDAAEPQLRSALDQMIKLNGKKHRDVGTGMNHLGLLLVTKGKLKEAEPLFHESLSILREVHGERHPEIATTLNNLAELYLLKGNLEAAEKTHHEELEMRRLLLGNDHPEVAVSLNDLAVVLGTKGDYATAEKLHREALQIIKKSRGMEHPDVASTLNNIAVMLESQKKYSEAEPIFREVLEMRRKLLGNEHPQVAWTLYNYSYLLYQKGDYQGAIGLAREVLTLRGKTLSDEHPMLAATLQVFGVSLLKLGNAAEAETVLRESLELRKKTLPADHWLVANSQCVLGNCLTQLGRFFEAEKLLVPGYSDLKIALGPKHERTQEALQWIIFLYQSWGKPELAKRYEQ